MTERSRRQDIATLLAEVEKLRADNERLRADLAVQQGCCDGAAAQDAHIRQEREEHRAEVEHLRAENERLRAKNERLRADNERLRGALTDMMSGLRYIRETYGDLAEENGR